MNREDFTPIMNLGFIPDGKEDGMMNPAVMVLNRIYDVKFHPQVLAGMLTSVLECVIDILPENEQIDFEKKALKDFNKIVKHRHEHVDKFKIDNGETFD
jgi:hypothetical protein